jgi:hypothetical protein
LNKDTAEPLEIRIDRRVDVGDGSRCPALNSRKIDSTCDRIRLSRGEVESEILGEVSPQVSTNKHSLHS